MTVFRGNSEADPMPGSEEQINRQALSIKRLTPTVISSGPDAGLRQSLADLRKGYDNAAKFQNEQDQQAAMQRASVDAQISANTPAPGVEFFGHRPEQYQTGDASQIPSRDPMWEMPIADLRKNLQLIEKVEQATATANATRNPMDVQHALDLGQQLQDHAAKTLQPFANTPAQMPVQVPTAQNEYPETFPDGSLYQLTDKGDGAIEVKLITGERFIGTPLEVTRKIAESNVHTKRWARQQRAQAQQQQPQPANGNGNGNGSEDAFSPDFGAWVADEQAKAFGFSDRNEMLRWGNQVNEMMESQRNQQIASDFLTRSPDYPNTPEAEAAIVGVIEKLGVDYTPDTLAAAHAYAVRNGLYQPLTVEQQRAALGIEQPQTRHAPPPMLRSGAPDAHGDPNANDPYKMPLEQLRKMAIREQLGGQQ